MNIDLTIINFTGQEAASYRVRYARTDNTNNPVFNVAGNPTAAQFPFTVSNIPNGSYNVGITPVYADGRTCSETVKSVSNCLGINSFNVTESGNNFQVTYSADDSVPQVYLTVNYPNGGSFQQAYTNGANSSTILVPIPVNLYGNYSFYLQSICDPDTGYYSPATPPVTITVSQQTTNNYTISAAYGVNIDSVSGVGIPAIGGALSGQNVQGIHANVTGDLTVVLSGSPVTSTQLIAAVNGVTVQIVHITVAGTYHLNPVTASSSDNLLIAIALV